MPSYKSEQFVSKYWLSKTYSFSNWNLNRSFSRSVLKALILLRILLRVASLQTLESIVCNTPPSSLLSTMPHYWSPGSVLREERTVSVWSKWSIIINWSECWRGLGQVLPKLSPSCPHITQLQHLGPDLIWDTGNKYYPQSIKQSQLYTEHYWWTDKVSNCQKDRILYIKLKEWYYH